MRARMQPWRWRMLAMRSPMTGTMAMAGGSRSLRVSLEPEAELGGAGQRVGQRRAGRGCRGWSRRRKTSAVTTGISGLTSTRWQAGKCVERRDDLADAAELRQGRESRQSGTSAPRVQRERRAGRRSAIGVIGEAGEEAEGRGGVGGAAAEAGGDRQVLVQATGRGRRAALPGQRARKAATARRTRLVSPLPSAAREGAGDREAVRRPRAWPRVRRRGRRRRRGFRACDSRRRGGR